MAPASVTSFFTNESTSLGLAITYFVSQTLSLAVMGPREHRRALSCEVGQGDRELTALS